MIRVSNNNTLHAGSSLLPAGHALLGKLVKLHGFQCKVITSANCTLALLEPLTGGLYVSGSGLLAASTNMITSGGNQAAANPATYTDPINGFLHVILHGTLPSLPLRLEELWFSGQGAAVLDITQLLMWVTIEPSPLEL